MFLTESEVDALAEALSRDREFLVRPEDILQVFALHHEEIEKLLDGIADGRSDVVEEYLRQFDFDELLWTIEQDTIPTQQGSYSNSGMRGDRLGFLVKTQGKRWYIHRYDKDPFPSDPHAHNDEDDIKLDLTNGDCYSTKHKKIVRQIRLKDLLEIRGKFIEKGVKMPDLAV